MARASGEHIIAEQRNRTENKTNKHTHRIIIYKHTGGGGGGNANIKTLSKKKQNIKKKKKPMLNKKTSE